jgi:hypothetical protein
MKTIALVAAGLFAGTVLAGAGPASAADGPACLQSQFIDHTNTVNPTTVRFYMRGGKVWQNNLPTPCNGLKLHGFVVQGHDSEICGGQGISVLETREVCVLGKFAAYQPPMDHPAP